MSQALGKHSWEDGLQAERSCGADDASHTYTVVPKAEFCLRHYKACDNVRELSNITKWLLSEAFLYQDENPKLRNPRHTSTASLHDLGLLTSPPWTGAWNHFPRDSETLNLGLFLTISLS